VHVAAIFTSGELSSRSVRLAKCLAGVMHTEMLSVEACPELAERAYNQRPAG
jgi:hypothetical protein